MARATQRSMDYLARNPVRQANNREKEDADEQILVRQGARVLLFWSTHDFDKEEAP